MLLMPLAVVDGLGLMVFDVWEETVSCTTIVSVLVLVLVGVVGVFVDIVLLVDWLEELVSDITGSGVISFVDSEMVDTLIIVGVSVGEVDVSVMVLLLLNDIISFVELIELVSILFSTMLVTG